MSPRNATAERAAPAGRRAAPPKRSASLGQGWATTDEEERQRRVLRGERAEGVAIRALEPSLAPFGRYLVALDGRPVESGYPVEFRGFGDESPSTCACPDYRVNGLGTCKHVEALKHALRRKRRASLKRRVSEVLIDRRGDEAPVLTVADVGPAGAGGKAGARKASGTASAVRLPESLAMLAGSPRYTPALATRVCEAINAMTPAQRRRWRVAASLQRQLEQDRRERMLTQRLRRIGASSDPATTGLKLPLYPYQREGMLHLVTRRRAILADEMGLGKTVQAIAACTLLARLGLAERVLVISPASLKGEWQEQIALFTERDSRVVAGSRRDRLDAYEARDFFTLVNYEQILRDGDDVQRCLAPDIIVLDEAQRIKNWQAKTADAVKRLRSDYAFVLTGTPLENRIDEIYSIMQFIDPEVLGPLFRFNRDYHVLDERGRPQGYQNLDKLHARLQPHLLRRGKRDVEGDLPPCSVRTLFVPMTGAQRDRYREHEAKVARLTSIAKRRPLLPDEMKRLQIALGCMRMTCDTPYILDPNNRDAPKLDELDPLIDELLEGEHKIIVFSEWTKMLELLQERLEARGIGYALHTGAVPQKRRRVEIDRFKRDPDCRLFLSSESGGAGLNLQVADVVVNLDLPWNPAKLAQRIARAWRKHQTRSVQVINLVADDSIERNMLGRLEAKQRLADGVLDGGLAEMALPSGRAALLAQLDELMPAATAVRAKANGPTSAPDTAASVDASDDQPGSRQGESGSLLERAVARFAPALRRVSLVRGDDKCVLFIASVGEQEPIERWFRQALVHENEASPWSLQLLSPETLDQLHALHGAGAVQLAGELRDLLVGGTPTGDASVLDREIAEASQAASEAARKAALDAALREIIAPHVRPLQAAALLAEQGFEEQTSALVAPVIERLRIAFAELDDLPEPFRPDALQSDRAPFPELLRYA